MSLIRLQNISRVYKMGDTELKALNDVSLTIEQGEFVAIIGPSGSGKSTLMQILGLLDRPSAGSYFFMGKDVSTLADDEGARLRSRSIGFIFQMFNLLSRTTALDNVLLPMIYSGTRKNPEKAKDILVKVDLQDRMHHKPNQLSGGQQQRVAIARSLANDPPIIFADEPTGNLASDQAAEILKWLKNLNCSGKTVILVTHDNEIAAHANRLIRIKDGCIVADEKKNSALPDNNSKPEALPPLSKPGLFDELKEQTSSALKALTSNKIRSGLSVLGILIGVAAVIAMLAIGRGAQKAIETRISSLGSNLLMLRPSPPRTAGGARGEGGSFSRLTMDDITAIEKIPGVKRVEGNISGSAQVVNGGQNWNVSLTGATYLYEKMRNSTPYYGRFFTDAEDSRMDRVALLGQTTVNNLFGTGNPVGKSIKINRINFEVIGVLPIKGANMFRDQDDTILIPLQTAMRRVFGKRYLDSVSIECESSQVIDATMELVRDLMRKRHRLPAYKEDDFDIRNMADLQATLTSTTQTFTVLLSTVAAISLLVGGIGIMNIMLVSVSERTREIGLRKAVGATRQAVLSQFLIEATVLALTGGGMGVLLGTGISMGLSSFAGWAADVTASSVLIAFSFSVAVGIVFGFWPARKASLLSPIEALRYE